MGATAAAGAGATPEGVDPGAIPEVATFSIVACDPEEGFWGVAVQSRVPSAGSIVPAARAGVGAIATQALANVAYKDEALTLLSDGWTAAEVKDHFVESDPGIARRQFAIADAHCNLAVHTGESTSGWAGHRTGDGYSVQGNILTGQEVVDAMAEAYEEATREGWLFGERLLHALQAGQEAGGDARGRQGAGILVVREGAGYQGGDDRYADLRVEDHVEPILELRRVWGQWMQVFHPADWYVPRGRQAVSVPSGAHICELRRMLTALGHDDWDGSGGCALDENVIPALRAFQREAGLTEAPAVNAATARALRDAVAELQEGGP
ncbi:MAG: DUF1028 domain-containing protein [Gemmatimonadales bacterium]|nr:MAG: DUF1028 domain-containing protein [Gemmatimonadales bacterium]